MSGTENIIEKLNGCDKTYKDPYAELERLRMLCYEAAALCEEMHETIYCLYQIAVESNGGRNEGGRWGISLAKAKSVFEKVKSC